MIRALALLFLGLIALPDAARCDVALRSGEHADFSRLVLYFEDAPDSWALGRDEDGYRLEVNPAERVFDTSTVFDFIPRRRILDLRSREDGLAIDVTCDCHAEAFEHDKGILVIDIRDGPARPGSTFEKPLPAPQTADNQNGKSDPSLPTQRLLPPFLPTATPIPPAIPFNPPVRVVDSTLLQTLSETVARAASEGLATPSAAAKADAFLRAQDRPGAPGIEISTGLDLADPHRMVPNSAEPRACPASDLFDLRNWGSEDQSAGAFLLEARTDFLEDLEQPSDAAVVALAKAYLYLGFGAEAAQVLSAYPLPEEDRRWLSQIAAVLDDPGENEAEDLRQFVGCDTDVALWALLASQAADADAGAPNQTAILQALSGLPLHLRRHLAPAVSQALRRAGLTEGATMARATVFRAVDDTDGAMDLERVRAEDPNMHGEADRILDHAAQGNDEIALSAMTEQMRRIAQSGGHLDEAGRIEVEARLHEAKGAPEANRLLEAYVAALAAQEDHAAALAYLQRIATSKHTDPGVLAAQINATLFSLAETASDGAFLVTAARLDPERVSATIETPVLGAILARLDALGFDAVANRLREKFPMAAAVLTAEAPQAGPETAIVSFGAVAPSGSAEPNSETENPPPPSALRRQAGDAADALPQRTGTSAPGAARPDDAPASPATPTGFERPSLAAIQTLVDESDAFRTEAIRILSTGN